MMAELTTFFSSPEWVLIGATVQGSHHLLESIPCQDAQGFRAIRDTIVVAIADGMSSASQAASGAELSIRATLESAAASLLVGIPASEEQWIEVMKTAFSSARSRLDEEASIKGVKKGDFATTLILAILTPNWLATAQIGDGAVVLLDEAGLFSTVCLPQSGEFINETFAITLPDALDRIVYHASQVRATAISLFTDGLQHISIHQADCSPHIPFFAPLFRQLPGITDASKAALSLAGFLTSEKVRQLSADDKTLVLVGRNANDR